jgi:hypothetical protein
MSEALPAVPLLDPLRRRPWVPAVAACALAAAATAGVLAVTGGKDEPWPFPPVIAGTSLQAVPLYEVVRAVGPGEAAGELRPGQRLVPAASTIGFKSYVIGAEPAAELRAEYVRLRIVGASRPWWNLELYAPQPPKLPTGPEARLVAVSDGRAYVPMTVDSEDGINVGLLGGSSSADALALATTLTPNVHQCGPATPPRAEADPGWSCVWAGPSS